MSFNLDDYNDVPSRLNDLREKHPEASLQPADLNHPYRIETVGDKVFVVYVAAAYRTPDDPRPGIGAAWEPFPGLTPYTKNSELQNAETSAWGRAIVAVLAADAKRGVASREDVGRRQAEQGASRTTKPKKPNPVADQPPAEPASQVTEVHEKCKAFFRDNGWSPDDARGEMESRYNKLAVGALTVEEAADLLAHLESLQPEEETA